MCGPFPCPFGSTCHTNKHAAQFDYTIKPIFEDKVRLFIHQTQKCTGITDNIIEYRTFFDHQNVLFLYFQWVSCMNWFSFLTINLYSFFPINTLINSYRFMIEITVHFIFHLLVQ